MVRQFNNDQFSSLILFACGLASCIGSLSYGLGNLHNPGVGFMPFLAGLAMAVLSVIGFASSTFRKKSNSPWKSPMKGTMWGRALFTVVVLIAYPFLLPYFGFTVGTALCASFLFRVGKFYQWPIAILGGLVTAFGTYGVFGALLKVQLPRGPWGF